MVWYSHLFQNFPQFIVIHTVKGFGIVNTGEKIRHEMGGGGGIKHSVILQVAHKYHISNSYVDYEGYSISSKGFLPTVVDIMVILVKFAHSSPF